MLDWVRFSQFKKRKKQPWRIFTFSSNNCIKKTLPMGVSYVFSIVQTISNYSKCYIHMQRNMRMLLGNIRERTWMFLCYYLSAGTLKENISVLEIRITFLNSFVEIFTLLLRRFLKYFKFEWKLF